MRYGESLSLRERGLKSACRNAGCVGHRSLSLRERGLKLHPRLFGKKQSRSLSLRERGLKLGPYAIVGLIIAVALLARAWIEI